MSWSGYKVINSGVFVSIKILSESLVLKFPKLHMLYPTFRVSVNRVQGLFTKLLYYISNNNQNERPIFTTHFSYKTWLGLFEKEQKKHTLLKCETRTRFFRTSCIFQQHSKANIWSMWKFNLTCNFKVKKKKQSKTSQTQALNIRKDVVDILQPIVENKVGTFKTKLSQT